MMFRWATENVRNVWKRMYTNNIQHTHEKLALLALATPLKSLQKIMIHFVPFFLYNLQYINCIKCCKNSPTEGKHPTSNNICQPDRKEACAPAYEQMSTEGDSKLTAWRHHWSALQTSPVVSRLATLIHIQEVKRFQMGFILFSTSLSLFFSHPHIYANVIVDRILAACL